MIFRQNFLRINLALIPNNKKPATWAPVGTRQITTVEPAWIAWTKMTITIFQTDR